MPYKDPERAKQYGKKHYLDNKLQYSGRTKQYRLILRDEINKFKEAAGCTDCKIMYPYYVLQFDHLDGHTKSATINNLIRSSTRAAVLAEIEKCEIVCANCHAARSFLQAGRRLDGELV